MKIGTNIDLNTKSFTFLDSSRFKTTEWREARIVELVLLDRISNSSSCLPSLINATPRYLNFSTCFNDTPPTCREHWTRFLETCSTAVLEVLMFIPAMSHAAAKGDDFEEASKTKSFAMSNRLILHLSIMRHPSVLALAHSVCVKHEKER